MPCTSAAARLWIAVALAASACGGDYWLGGRADGGGRSDGGKPDAAVEMELELDGDLVLTGDESFELGDGKAVCRLIGHGHAIRSEGVWRGSLTLRGCTVIGLGSASSEAIALELSERGRATIEGNTFDASGAIHVTNWNDSSTVFRDNVVLESSLVDLDASFDATTPAFLAEGTSPAPKLFQGNRIQRSLCWFRSPNWLIGGDSDRDSNLVVGLRAGLVLAASGIVVRGNYVHNLREPGAGDESALSVIYETTDVLAEHNVLRGGTWVVRGFGGELRYNAILDADHSAWLSQPFEHTTVHHNLFAMCHAPADAAPGGIAAGIHLVNDRAVGIELYNNTLHGGGPEMRLTGAPVTIDERCELGSLRNNLIFDFPYARNDGGAAAVRPGLLEGVEPPPVRLGYADYNLFHNPDAEQIRNYAVAVSGRALREDPGFALHDASAFGPIDEQVEPALAAPSNDCFAWSDEDVLSGGATVSTMLASLRAAYEPLPESPALAAGDPADGAGTAIGAVGDGGHPDDRFGTFAR